MRLCNNARADSQAMPPANLNNFLLLKNLNPYNPDAKRMYFALLPKVVADAIDNNSSIDNCKELLYFISSNSQLTMDERQLVQKLMNQLNDSNSKTTENSFWPPKSRTPPPSFENWNWNAFINSADGTPPANQPYSDDFRFDGAIHTVPADQPRFNSMSTYSNASTPSKSAISNNSQDTAPWSRCRRSLSLTSTIPQTVANGGHPMVEWSTAGADSGQDDVFSHMKTFRYHGDLSPQNSLSGGSGSTSSGENSESTSTTIKRNTFVEPGSGMRDVPMWLKSLRLHKYSPLFAQLTYEEMMGLTEEQLEHQGVTKGARHKIVLSIQKLKDRPNLLRQLEKDLADVGSLKTTLNELKLMTATPIRACALIKNEQEKTESVDDIDDADLPALLTRVLAQACMHLLTLSNADEDCFNLSSHLLDRCLNHEAFTPHQKKHCLVVKQQIRRIWNPAGMIRKLGPRSNSWNKDRRTCASSQPQISPVVGVQRQNTVCSVRPITLTRNSNGLTPSYSTNSQASLVQLESNGVLYHPTSLYQTTVIQAPANQPNRSLFSPLDSDSFFAEGRNHTVVQRTISAPAFRLPAGQQPAAMNGLLNRAQQPANQKFSTDSNRNHCCLQQNYFAAPANQNGWCDDAGSLFANGYSRQIQNSPFPSRSAWSCGFEESTSPGGGHSRSFVGPIGSSRQSGGGFMQISRGQGCNQSAAAGANFLPMTNSAMMTSSSSNAAGLSVNDMNVWNMDQLCRRVMEAALDCETFR